MDARYREAGSDGIDGFDNCASPQAVIKSGSDGDGSEGDPLGAFVLAVVAIMVENDVEEVNDGSPTSRAKT